MGKRNVGNRGIQDLHEGGQSHRHRNYPRIEAGRSGHYLSHTVASMDIPGRSRSTFS